MTPSDAGRPGRTGAAPALRPGGPRGERRRRTSRRLPIALVLPALLCAAPASELGGASAEPTPVLVSPSCAGEVTFPHELHYEALEFECSLCHHETNAGRLRMPHPEYFIDFWIECANCHREDETPTRAQACSNCHHSDPATIADQTLSSKVVIHKSCWGCHEAGTGAAASESCSLCHSGDVESH